MKNFNFEQLKAKAHELGIDTKGMTKEVIIEAIKEKGEGGTGKRGRPVVEGSERQQRLADQAAKAESGEPIKRGRPSDEGSERQKRLAKMAEKKALGLPVKPGRPKMVDMGEEVVSGVEVVLEAADKKAGKKVKEIAEKIKKEIA